MNEREIKPHGIPLFKTKPVEIPELPSWIQAEAAKSVNIHVSVFDKTYLWLNESIQKTRWAIALLSFVVKLILFIQGSRSMNMSKEKLRLALAASKVAAEKGEQPYTPPAWISTVKWVAKSVRWIGGLASGGGVLGGFIDTKWGFIIFSAAYGVGKLSELFGDYLDDKKFNESFQAMLDAEANG